MVFKIRVFLVSRSADANPEPSIYVQVIYLLGNCSREKQVREQEKQVSEKEESK